MSALRQALANYLALRQAIDLFDRRNSLTSSLIILKLAAIPQ
jgi:hypothetical protein